MPEKHPIIEKHRPIIANLILILVLLSAAAGLYYMYRVSVGKAFIEAPYITVIQRELEFCCCAPTARPDHPFEVFGKVLKDADPAAKEVECNRICGEHSSTAHPANLLYPGRCYG